MIFYKIYSYTSYNFKYYIVNSQWNDSNKLYVQWTFSLIISSLDTKDNKDTKL